MNPNGRGLLERVKDAMRSFRIDPTNLEYPALARLFGGEPQRRASRSADQNALNLSGVFDGGERDQLDDRQPAAQALSPPAGRRSGALRRPSALRTPAQQPEHGAELRAVPDLLDGQHVVTGNGFAEIERDVVGRPAALWPIAPHRVTPQRNEARPPALRRAPQRRLGRDDPGRGHVARYRLVARWRRRPEPDRVRRESLGLAAAAERFGATFFGRNGSTFGGFFEPSGAAEP